MAETTKVVVVESFNTTMGAACKDAINATNRFAKAGDAESAAMQRTLARLAFEKWFASFEEA